MNDDRRKRIGSAIRYLEMAKTFLEKVDIESIRDEEQEAFDNMPEGLQQGEAGQKAEEMCGELDSAVSELETAVGSLDEIIAYLENCEPEYPKPAKSSDIA